MPPSSQPADRCIPVPEPVYLQSATTRSSLRAARAGSAIRPPDQTAAGSSGAPFSVIPRTARATKSAWLAAPGSAQSNRITETEPKASFRLRSSTTSYERTRSNLARSLHSARVISALGISPAAINAPRTGRKQRNAA
jgi:hypothetical protein